MLEFRQKRSLALIFSIALLFEIVSAVFLDVCFTSLQIRQRAFDLVFAAA